MTRVMDKVALITGGGGGLGRAIAQRLGENGARIVITDLQAADGASAAKDLRELGLSATFIEHDVANEASWIAVIREVVATHGRLDVLVNNAGVSARVRQPLDDIPFDEWQRVLGVNLNGVFLGVRHGIKAMKETGGGSIVNIGSVAALVGTPGGAAYGTSKGGVHALTRQAAYSCGKHHYNIRVNAIAPSYVWTPLVADRAIAEHGSKEAALSAFASRSLLGRVNMPDDIAWAVVYLASEEARQITGIELVIDGGQMVS